MPLPLPAREIIRGLTGGTGFLAAWLALGMPWWLAALLGVGLYAGASFVLPALAPPEQVSVAPGVTARERDEFAARCAGSAEALRQIARQMTEGELRSCVERLAQTAARLAAYCQRKPESMLAAVAVPDNLDHLVKMLRQYVELSQFPSPGVTVGEALRKVEETVGNATLALEGIYEQLLNDDVAALQASAASLGYLLGVEADLERARRSRQTEELPDLSRLAAGPSSARPPRMERPQ